VSASIGTVNYLALHDHSVALDAGFVL